jgi:hypothetical protein
MHCARYVMTSTNRVPFHRCMPRRVYKCTGEHIALLLQTLSPAYCHTQYADNNLQKLPLRHTLVQHNLPIWQHVWCGQQARIQLACTTCGPRTGCFCTYSRLLHPGRATAWDYVCGGDSRWYAACQVHICRDCWHGLYSVIGDGIMDGCMSLSDEWSRGSTLGLAQQCRHAPAV